MNNNSFNEIGGTGRNKSFRYLFSNSKNNNNNLNTSNNTNNSTSKKYIDILDKITINQLKTNQYYTDVIKKYKNENE